MPELVEEAVRSFGGTASGKHCDRRLWTWFAYRLGANTFLNLLFQQMAENESDGVPRNPPAAFQAKLSRAIAEIGALERKA